MALALCALSLLVAVVVRKRHRDVSERRGRALRTRLVAIIEDPTADPAPLMAAAQGGVPDRVAVMACVRVLGVARRHALAARSSSAPDAERLARAVARQRDARSPAARAIAAWLTGLLELPGAPRDLADLLRADPDAEVRLAAAGALAKTGEPSAVDALVAALRSGDLPTGRLTERLTSPWMDVRISQLLAWEEDPAIRVPLLLALSVLHSPLAGDPARRGLESPCAEERAAAVRLLGMEPTATTITLLRAALHDPDPRVRGAAALAVGGDPAATDDLTAALEDDAWMVRDAAARSLAGLGAPGRCALDRAITRGGRAASHAREWRAWSPAAGGRA